jgi:hypothetical protein
MVVVAEKSKRILTIEIDEDGAVQLRTLLGGIAYLNGPLLDLFDGLREEDVGEEYFHDVFESNEEGLEYVKR